MNRFITLTLILWLAFGLNRLVEVAFSVDRELSPPLIPLSMLPADFLGEDWAAEDLVLPDRMREIAGVSDYLYRKFTNNQSEVILWVGYVNKSPAETGVHYPEICFPYQGFELEDRRVVSVPGTGLEYDPRFYETQWTMDSNSLYCLYSFYHNGQFIPEASNLKLENILRRINYYAVVTLSGRSEGSLERTREIYFAALRKLIPRLLEHFPGEGVNMRKGGLSES